MDIRQNPLWLSIPCGSLFRTEIRVSIWSLLVALFLCLSLGWEVGLTVSAILFLSLLVHELAHIFAARGTGGSGHEILIWPLGGLAFANPAPTFFSEAWTTLAGPVSNGVICLCCLPHVLSLHALRDCSSFLYLPSVDLTSGILSAILLLAFSVNLKLFLVNMLLPIYPLDCGQLLYTCVKVYRDRHTAKIGSLWVGLIGAVLVLFAGLYWKSYEVMLMASVLLAICQYEFVVSQVSRSFDDSFMGYDFSQGYTSLEDSEDREYSSQPSLFEKWRRERAEKKREKEQLLKIETERRVDELLQKIHLYGKTSLTDDENRFLEQASNRYRSHGKE